MISAGTQLVPPCHILFNDERQRNGNGHRLRQKKAILRTRARGVSGVSAQVEGGAGCPQADATCLLLLMLDLDRPALLSTPPPAPRCCPHASVPAAQIAAGSHDAADNAGVSACACRMQV
eukprot:359371-Chlamydomonas_euryale.AAC.4